MFSSYPSFNCHSDLTLCLTHILYICTMALLFDNLEAIVLKRCLAFEPRAVRTKIGFPFCPLASVYTSMPDVFQARRNLQSHFSKSRLDCAYWIGLCPLHCQPSRYWCCSVSSAEICAISAKDRKLVGYDDLHLPPPNAAPCKVHSPHIWAEDWPGSGNLRYMGLLIRLQAQVRVPT